MESPKSASPPLVERRASASGADASAAAANGSGAVHAKPEVAGRQEKDEEEDDWLAGVLSRKKAQPAFDFESKSSRKEEPAGPGEELDLESNVG